MQDHQMRWGTTGVGGVTIVDRRVGGGPPIVFVHGLAVSGAYFEPTMCALAADFACSAPDLPGFGHSSNPPRVLDVPGHADALAAWLEARQLCDATLVGNSAGCQYIVDCVTRHPDIAGPLVLIGPTTDPRARTARGQIGRWLRTGRYADIKQLPVVLRDVRRAGVRRVAVTFRAVLDDRIEDKLAQVRQRSLVVRGANDPLVPRQWASQVVAALPDARLVEIDGGAHVVNFTHPRPVAAAITGFLSEADHAV